MLTKDEFELLCCLEETGEHLSQRQLAEALNISLGKINKLLKALTEKEYCDQNGITQGGRDALEPYRVQRAIFLAAGFDAHLVPITLNTPKPLIRVRGQRILDRMLDAVAAAEIPEVIVVRGYMAEQFDCLKNRYPRIRFVENPFFSESNNISSAMEVRHLLERAYVLDGDLVLRKPGLIRKYEFCSNALAFPVEWTDDWCITADRSGYVKSLAMGGENGYQLPGIFYWSREDGEKLAEDIKEVYEAPGGKKRLWEHVPLVYKKEHYRVAIRLCGKEDIAEINTFSELKKLDPAYDV